MSVGDGSTARDGRGAGLLLPAHWLGEAALKRRIRLVMLLDAAEQAGLLPLSLVRLHAFAYLSNVLAPVWQLAPLDGKLLKRQGGPFYPELQHDLDRLVGMGVVTIAELRYVADANERWRVDGSCRLNRAFAAPILEAVARYDDERRLLAFVQELAYALSALGDAELDRLFTQDATYTDPLVSVDNVIDFAEWRDTNHTADVANYFDRLLPGGIQPTMGEKLHLYARHLHRRFEGAS